MHDRIHVNHAQATGRDKRYAAPGQFQHHAAGNQVVIARTVHGARIHDHSGKPACDSLQNNGLGAMFAVGVHEGCAECIE